MYWFFAAVEELLPVLLFFLAQWHYSFSIALSLMVVSTLLLVGAGWWWGTGIPKFAVVSTIFLLVFAIPSIVLKDPLYIMLSDTILDGGFALLLLISLRFKKTILQYFFERLFALPDRAWRTLTWRWGTLFLLLATANEVIRVSVGLTGWSTFKLVATITILLFGVWQFRLSARERIVSESNWLGLRTTHYDR